MMVDIMPGKLALESGFAPADDPVVPVAGFLREIVLVQLMENAVVAVAYRYAYPMDDPQLLFRFGEFFGLLQEVGYGVAGCLCHDIYPLIKL